MRTEPMNLKAKLKAKLANDPTHVDPKDLIAVIEEIEEIWKWLEGSEFSLRVKRIKNETNTTGDVG